MKKLLFLTCVSLAAAGTMNSQNIAAARAQGVGANVTIKGVCINGPELGSIRYVQDNSGGIAVYGSNLSTLSRGDSVQINGPITAYNNLYEIQPATFVYLAAGHIPNPQVITPGQFSEPYEGMLVKVQNLTFSASGNFGANMNYTVSSGTETMVVRTNTASPIVGQAIPNGPVDIVGIGSQFCSTPTSGCTTGYELLIRDMADVTAAVPQSIRENNMSTLVSVYPNPASGVVNFNVGNNEQVKSVKVTDALGRVVFSAVENVNSINVSTFSKGMYNLNVSTAKGSYQSKFIVE